MGKDTELTMDYAIYRLLQDSLNSLSIGVTISDIGGKIIYTNIAEATMHGYTTEELIGKDARIFAPPSQWKRLEFEELHKIGSWKRESINIRKNGELFPVGLTSIAVKSEKGVPIGIITVCEDITQQKKSEEILKESEERYRNLFENAHDMIQSVAPDGHFLFVNPAWLKAMGYVWDELHKITIFDILHPSCMSHCTKAFRSVMSGRSFDNIEAIFVAKDGRPINVEGNVNARFSGGRVIASHGIFRDVTERKRTEDALRESEERFKAIFDNAADGILVADIENRKFHSCNKMLSQMLGYSQEEVKNLGVMDIHPRKELPYVIELFKKQSIGEITFAKDVPVKRKDGNIFYADINSFTITFAGKAYLTGIFRDITDRKKAEEEIKGKIKELEEFYDMAVGRELRMKELKDEMKELREEIERLRQELDKYKGRK
jgi:PAS domain S-box-containing protein